MTTALLDSAFAPTRPRTSPRALAAGTSLAMSTVLGTAGVRPFRERMELRRSTLNDTLPVHSKWWREHGSGDGELLYVALGDSAAQGIGASRPDRSYVGVLAEGMRSASARSIRTVNLSVSGATTGLAVRDQLPRLRTLSPDVVTVAIGANDIAEWDATAFDRNLRAILDELPEHAIVGELPCFHFPQNERKVAEANRMLRAAARSRGLAVAPLHSATRRQGLPGILTQFARDMFHPNDRGYAVWAEAFRPFVAERLGVLSSGGALEAVGALEAAGALDVGGRG
ncbi:SGNH/GDSL hydrolase family protein [Agromyces sp. NPDC058136]|uniref:SGNH/GDSL hydrolase family protein n=1 Tax=Agromyces sp. NPDC058136 TaxID=3346354 RepID=UPI0036DA75D2